MSHFDNEPNKEASAVLALLSLAAFGLFLLVMVAR